MSHLSERVLSFRSLVYLAEDFAVTTRFEIANTSVGSVVVSLDHPSKTRGDSARLEYIHSNSNYWMELLLICVSTLQNLHESLKGDQMIK